MNTFNKLVCVIIVFKCIRNALVEGMLFAPDENSGEWEGRRGRSENESTCQYGSLCLLTSGLTAPSCPDSSLSSSQEMQHIYLFPSLR